MMYDIWSEGYRANGDSGTATLHVEQVEASSFEEACKSYFESDPDFDPVTMRYWACKLFDNEADARRSYG